MKKQLLIILAAAILVVSQVAGASAAPVTTFGYNYHVGITEVNGGGLPSDPGYPSLSDQVSIPTAGGNNDNVIVIPESGPDFTNAHHKVEWGNPVLGNRVSSIELNPVTPALPAGAMALGPTAATWNVNAGLPAPGNPNAMAQVHINNRITAPVITNGKVVSTLQLKDNDVADAPTVLLTARFDFDFIETFNTDGNGNTVNVDDFFIVTANSLTSNFFIYEDYIYQIDFSESFDDITQSLIDTVGDQYADGQTYLGWATEEEARTSRDVSFRINLIGPAPVPEPSTFALLGLGILGVAIYSRRRTE